MPFNLDLDALADRLADRLARRLGGRSEAPPQRYLSVAQAAQYAGLSSDSVRALLSGGRLTALRPVAGRVLVDKRQLDALMSASTARPRRRRGVYDRARPPG
jgi:excisionase family DNA binding protein